ELALGALIDLSDEFHTRLVEKRYDLLTEIDFVDFVDLRSDLQRDFERARDPDRPVGPLLRRDTAEERHVVAIRPVSGLEKLAGEAVIDGTRKIGVRDRFALRVGDRHQRHVAESDIERLEIVQILPAVQGGHGPVGDWPKQRKLKLVDVEVQNVEL